MPRSISLDEMSVEQLQAQLDRLNAERDALKEQIRRISPVLDAKLARTGAERKLAAMSDSERTALAQLLRTAGISSGEAVGTPGA